MFYWKLSEKLVQPLTQSKFLTEVKIAGATIGNVSVEYEYIKKIRASYYLLGALLGKYKNAEVPLPGGCNIGSRPIDQHLKGFRALGASVDIIHGAVVAKGGSFDRKAYFPGYGVSGRYH